MESSPLVLWFDLMGVFFFALSGNLLAARKDIDITGGLVLGLLAGLGGGIIRDVLLGATPPGSLVDWRYAAVSIAAGLLTFYRHAQVERLQNPVQLSVLQVRG